MMSEREVLQSLQKVGAVIMDSHIVYTSGKHGRVYINKDAIYPQTHLTSRLCQALAQEVVKQGREVSAVVAPAIGGVILSQWTAYHLTGEAGWWEVAAVYAEKTNDGSGFVIRRGYDKFVTGSKVLVVEDVINTGGSIRKVIEAVRRQGGEVVAAAALCNRGGVRPEDIGNPPCLIALANLQLEAWEEASCPLCEKGVPINTEVGKGREFIARRGIDLV